jgi:hypothetical protein
MLRCVTDARAVEEEVVVAARGELERTAPMKLDHRICPTGEAVVDLGGDLDVLSADVAVNYVTDVIDRHRGPVTVNLTALAFCDARGLAALERMSALPARKPRSHAADGPDRTVCTDGSVHEPVHSKAPALSRPATVRNVARSA